MGFAPLHKSSGEEGPFQGIRLEIAILTNSGFHIFRQQCLVGQRASAPHSNLQDVVL